MEEGFKLCKRALVLDFMCIAVSMMVLFLAYKQLLPYWALVTGALVALVLLVVSLYMYFKGRKLMKSAYSEEVEEDEPQE